MRVEAGGQEERDRVIHPFPTEIVMAAGRTLICTLIEALITPLDFFDSKRAFSSRVRTLMTGAVLAGRLPKLTLECAIEGRFRLVSDVGGYFRDASRCPFE